MLSTSQGHIDCSNLLIDEMKMVDYNKCTALHKTCFCGYPLCVKLLLEKVEIVNKDGKTPLAIAKS